MLDGYADENVKAAVVDGVRLRGMDVVTAQERDQRETDDEELLETAAAENRLLLTNDTDFLRIHAEWCAAGRNHAGIVYWHQNRSIGDAVRGIAEYAELTAPEDAANMVRFL
jgi:Domain of unknown function (DUF5615)